ncbi:hypothetical protein [Salinimicrobium sp. GXAS 041]|uniref:hypothetical protein n=1 Tax=Salinimicrobium sp. GXAS 041 TaxID=3400806 RepID=UPI003C71BBF9
MNSQVINSLLIIIGGGLLVFQIAIQEKNVYIMILGLVFLMFGLYRATNYWVETKDDHKNNEDAGDGKNDRDA